MKIEIELSPGPRDKMPGSSNDRDGQMTRALSYALSATVRAGFLEAMARNGMPLDDRSNSHGIKIRSVFVSRRCWTMDILLDGRLKWSIFGKHNGVVKVWPLEFARWHWSGAVESGWEAVASFDRVVTQMKLDVLEMS